jgi:hypothetical protein
MTVRGNESARWATRRLRRRRVVPGWQRAGDPSGLGALAISG